MFCLSVAVANRRYDKPHFRYYDSVNISKYGICQTRIVVRLQIRN